MNPDDELIASLIASTDDAIRRAHDAHLAHYADLPDIREVMRDMPKSDRSIKRSHRHSVRHKSYR